MFCYHDLPEDGSIQRDFDYMNESEKHQFTIFKYRGVYYDYTQFDRVSPYGELHKAGWCASFLLYASYAILVKFVEDDIESGVVVGRCW